MTAEPPTGTPEPQPKKTPLLFPSRIILFTLLPIAIGALVFDFGQRGKRQEVFDSVAKLIPTDTDSTLPARFSDADLAIENIHKVIGRAPDKVLVDNKTEIQELYSWRGVMYTYNLRVVYMKGVVLGTNPIVSGVYPEQVSAFSQ